MRRIVRLPGTLGIAAAAIVLMSAAAAVGQQAAPKPEAPAAAQSVPQSVPAASSRSGWRGACGRDLKQFCGGTAGGAAKRLCLDSNTAKLSAACQAALVERRQQRAEVRKICSAEIQSLCKDIASGGGARLQCLQQKSSEAGAACAKALAGLSPSASSKRTPAPKN